MSEQKEMTKIELRSNRPGSMTQGCNTELLINGELLPFVHSFKLEVKAGEIAKATIETYGDFSVKILGEFDHKIMQLKPPEEKKDD